MCWGVSSKNPTVGHVERKALKKQRLSVPMVLEAQVPRHSKQPCTLARNGSLAVVKENGPRRVYALKEGISGLDNAGEKDGMVD